MEPADALPEHDIDTYVPMSDAVVEVLGKVLAAVASILDGEALLRRGGPGLFRRLASSIAAFIALVIALLVRHHAIVGRSFVTIIGSRTLRHLRRPPHGWAAP